MALLEFDHVYYSNQGKEIIKDFSLSIESGDFISVVGPSGSGKSTFFKLCCHLLSPTGGSIAFRGKPVLEYSPMDLRKEIVYCFQTPYLFGDTVMDNISFPYQIRDSKVDLHAVSNMFEMLNLTVEYLNKEVKNLSGGEKQRIALIRALLFRPQVLLLDEVTSALDVENTLIVEKAINSIYQQGTAILWITHNPEQSRRYAGKLLTIQSGEIKSLEVLE